jgi:NTP pyrophosphatase (non-canonical NTP hydrolase)
MDEKEIFKAALEHFGAESQTLMCFEEMSELQKELCKNARGKCNTMLIAEEIADVQIMLEQMILLHNCQSEVDAVRKFKVLRLEQKLKKLKGEAE